MTDEPSSNEEIEDDLLGTPSNPPDPPDDPSNVDDMIKELHNDPEVSDRELLDRMREADTDGLSRRATVRVFSDPTNVRIIEYMLIGGILPHTAKDIADGADVSVSKVHENLMLLRAAGFLVKVGEWEDEPVYNYRRNEVVDTYRTFSDAVGEVLRG